jgi:hypothetical protein
MPVIVCCCHRELEELTFFDSGPKPEWGKEKPYGRLDFLRPGLQHCCRAAAAAAAACTPGFASSRPQLVLLAVDLTALASTLVLQHLKLSRSSQPQQQEQQRQWQHKLHVGACSVFIGVAGHLLSVCIISGPIPLHSAELSHQHPLRRRFRCLKHASHGLCASVLQPNQL